MKTLITFALAVATFTAFGNTELSIQVEVLTPRVLSGEPVYFEAKIRGKDFTLPVPLSLCDLTNASRLSLMAMDESGNWSINRGSPGECVGSLDYQPMASSYMKKYDKEAVVTGKMYLRPGRFKYKIQYASKGPFYDVSWNKNQTIKKIVNGIWEGEIVSNEIEIQVDLPAGLDALAASACKYDLEMVEKYAGYNFRCDALQRREYAASTYAGWALRNFPAPHLLTEAFDPATIISDLEKPLKKRQGFPFSVRGQDDTGKEFMFTPEESAARYDELATLFLKAHSEHPAACYVWARLAMAKLYQKKWTDTVDAIHHSTTPACDRVLMIESPQTPMDGGWPRMKKNLISLKKEITKRDVMK